MSDTQVVDTSSNMSNAHIPDSVAAGETQQDSPGSTTGPADTAASGQPTEGEGEQPKPSRDRRAEKRIASLTRKNEELLTRLGRLEGIVEVTSARAPQKPEADAKPQPNQFKSYDEYVEALTDWKTDRKLAERETARQTQDRKQAEDSKAQERNRAIAERLASDAKDIEDFEDVWQTITARDFPVSSTMRDYLEDAERPALIAQWWADNPEEARRIYGMTSAAAVRELDKVAATLTRPARTTTAPPPGPTVGGRAVATRDPKHMDMDEYAAHWKQRNGIKD